MFLWQKYVGGDMNWLEPEMAGQLFGLDTENYTNIVNDASQFPPLFVYDSKFLLNYT